MDLDSDPPSFPFLVHVHDAVKEELRERLEVGIEKERMLRTRLFWFTAGFSTTAAAISKFVWGDLFMHRHAVSSDMTQKFKDLEARVVKLEGVPPQVEG